LEIFLYFFCGKIEFSSSAIPWWNTLFLNEGAIDAGGLNSYEQPGFSLFELGINELSSSMKSEFEKEVFVD